jgi:energy-coupling factor transporter ATP-binding protein EcfA2
VIEEIQIRDLGVINEARLEFRSGLNVLSGETGAGKTMVLTALGLLLGNRGDSSAVRANAQAAFVEGRWLLNANTELTERVHDAGGVIEARMVVPAPALAVVLLPWACWQSSVKTWLWCTVKPIKFDLNLQWRNARP